jgi:molybdenum cofactor guanylyltransferase
MKPAFLNPTSEFPEPLISIWEPKSYQTALSFLGQGISCPRKVLINSDTHLITVSNPTALMNVNTPDELATYQTLK